MKTKEANQGSSGPQNTDSRESIWTENGLTFTEIIKQEYGGNNCVISAAFVKAKTNRR
jgi:hypothetical protein